MQIDINIILRYNFSKHEIHRDFPGGLMVKNPPAMQEAQVLSLGWEDPLDKEVITHSSMPAWRIPWTEEPGGLMSMTLQMVKHD